MALVLVGLALSLFGVFTDINLTSDLILLVFLPPLLFEGAINMDLDDLMRRWHQVGVLAFFGTFISAAVIAVGLAWIPGMPFELAVVLAGSSNAASAVSTQLPSSSEWCCSR